MNDFKVGDSVRLKIGGPKMSIFSVEGIGIVCQWFSMEKGKQELKSGVFQPEQLKKDDNEGESWRVQDSHHKSD